MEFKINEIDYHTLPKLMQELVDHYEISKTLLGFLMLLNLDELNTLAESLENPTDLLGSFPLLTYFKGIPDEGTIMTTEELSESIRDCMADVSIVSLKKKGFVDLVPSENGVDDDWIIRPTEKGKELATDLFGKKEDNNEEE